MNSPSLSSRFNELSNGKAEFAPTGFINDNSYE